MGMAVGDRRVRFRFQVLVMDVILVMCFMGVLMVMVVLMVRMCGV